VYATVEGADGLESVSVDCLVVNRDLLTQIGLSQESMNAQPEGQVVRFAVVAKIHLASLRVLERPIGRAMIVAKISTKFITTNAVWSLPMTLLKLLASMPWQITQARKTAYTTPWEGVQAPSVAKTGTLKSMSEKP
jgi:hypothetical protein